MAGKKLTRALSAALSLLLLLPLSGCGGASASSSPASSSSAPASEASSAVSSAAPAETPDAEFTINYDPDASLDPYSTTDVYNSQLLGLLYEGLFTYDGAFTPSGVLCQRWDTADGAVWTLTLRSGVTFTDGTPLTAADAAYSIALAKAGGLYASRLACVASAEATGQLTLTVTLYAANYLLPALLDVPVIESGTGGAPVGTGPYVFSAGALTAYAGYRDYGRLQRKTLLLTHADESGVAEAFSEKKIDLVCYDPKGILPLNVHMEYETRLYDTADLLYLGFNTTQGALKSANVRRALGRLVDRSAVCGTVYDDAALSSPLILSPALEGYDAGWEDGTGYSLQAFSELFAAENMSDTNSDGFLESPEGEFKLTFIVSRENAARVAAAEKITQDMQATGVNVVLSKLSWEDFNAALGKGEFSMYLAEARLSPDFDASPLLAEGGGLNYGKAADPEITAALAAYFAAPDSGRSAAAGQLCALVRDRAPIVPIAYRKYAVLTHLGSVSGLEPSQSGIYRNMTDWQFGRS